MTLNSNSEKNFDSNRHDGKREQTRRDREERIPPREFEISPRRYPVTVYGHIWEVVHAFNYGTVGVGVDFHNWEDHLMWRNSIIDPFSKTTLKT